MRELLYQIYEIDKFTLGLAIFIPLYLVVMAVIHAIRRKHHHRHLYVWRILMFLPVLLCVVHFFVSRFHGHIALSVITYSLFYMSALFALIPPFIASTRKPYRIFMTIAIASSVFFGIVGCLNITRVLKASHIGNYSASDISTSFEKIVNDMKKNYALRDWKNVDLDRINTAVLPKVVKAQQEDNHIDYTMALIEYVCSIHDDSVRIEPLTARAAESFEKAKDLLSGYDHGFSMITLSDGKTIAILTDKTSEAYKAGIEDGVEIIEWNGIPISDAISKVKIVYPDCSCSLSVNENVLRPIFLAGKDEFAKVTYRTKGGKRKTVSFKPIGSYRSRLEKALLCLNGQEKEETYATDYSLIGKWLNDGLSVTVSGKERFSSRMISKDCGLITVVPDKINILTDTLSLVTKDYSGLKRAFSACLKSLSEEGTTTLVLDLRNADFDTYPIVNAISSFYSDRGDFGYSFGQYHDRLFSPICSYHLEAGIRIPPETVVLANMNTTSAANALVYILSKKGVTVTGITGRSSSAEPASAALITTNSEFKITYPVFAMLDFNRLPISGSDSAPTDDTAVGLKLDEKTALGIFVTDVEDPELVSLAVK